MIHSAPKGGVVAVTATTLTPFHNHTHATPSGTATGARFMADRSMSYALAGAMGALYGSPALFTTNYLRDMAALPWLCSMFETDTPRLLPPMGRRLNIEHEGGYSAKIQSATGTGNLKTWFFIQEVPPGQVFHGAVFGPDPFAMASSAAGKKIETIVVRTGRHLGGLVALRRSEDVERPVRLNAHTANLFGVDPNSDPDLGTDIFVLYDIQATRAMPLDAALRQISRLRPDLAA